MTAAWNPVGRLSACQTGGRCVTHRKSLLLTERVSSYTEMKAVHLSVSVFGVHGHAAVGMWNTQGVQETVALVWRNWLVDIPVQGFSAITLTMKNGVLWYIKTQFVLHRRHNTSPLQSPASKCSVKFEDFTAVTMKNVVFLDVTPCGSCKNRRFEGT
jgi:hypothetical protein